MAGGLEPSQAAERVGEPAEKVWSAMTIQEIDAEGSRRFESFLNEFGNLNYCRVRDTHQDGLRAQLEGIDYVAWDLQGREIPIELKTEQTNQWHNFYFELYQSVDPISPGWIQTITSNVLAYQFLDSRELYWMDVSELKAWLFGTGAFEKYPLKPQRKHATRHTAHGICVPIRDVDQSIEVQRFFLV